MKYVLAIAKTIPDENGKYKCQWLKQEEQETLNIVRKAQQIIEPTESTCADIRALDTMNKVNDGKIISMESTKTNSIMFVAIDSGHNESRIKLLLLRNTAYSQSNSTQQ